MSYILSFTIFSVSAQIVIKGDITNKDGKPVGYASITLSQKSNTNVLAYSISKDDGKYEIDYAGVFDTLEIAVSGFNIARQFRIIPAKTQTVNFEIEEVDIQLKDVQVKADKIYGNGDTINYLVSSFSDKKDLVIADVLKKMPGIDVAENGQIKYNGNPINKFYIENLDMLQGRYGIATNNISAKDVSSVQVLQNHQPVKALKDVDISKDPAINLKLKDGAKGTWAIMTQLGIGVNPLIWENELTGMYFAKGKQNITSYKGNNSGKDLSDELRSFTSSDRLSTGNMVDIRMPSPPEIDRKRYLFNNSNAMTVNNLKEFKPGKQLNFNLIYLNDYKKRKSTAQSAYYLPGDSILTIDEELSTGNNIDRLESEIRYNANDSNYYLNNYLNLEGQWERGTGDIINDQSIHQSLYRPTLYVSNTFNLIKKQNSGKGFNLTSFNGFRTIPQTLSIHPGIYPNVFNNGFDYNFLQQDVRLNTFRSNNRISLLSAWMIDQLRITPRINFNIESQSLHSELVPIAENVNNRTTPDSLKNNLNWMKSDIQLSADIRYHTDKFKLDINVPVSYNTLYLYNQIEKEKHIKGYFFFQPSMSLQYRINQKVEINGNYNFYNSLGNIQALYPGYILQNYRRLNAYDSRLSKALVNGGTLEFSYKDLIYAFFFNLSASYNHIKRDILYGQDFVGIMNITSSIEQNNVSENTSVTGKISKGFDFWRLVCTLEGTYGSYSSEQLRQKELIRYNNEGKVFSGTLFMRPVEYMGITYKGTFGENRGRIDSKERFPTIHSFVNTVNFDLLFFSTLGLNIDLEHYHNSASIGNKNLSFVDLGIWYTWKKMRVTIDWLNIFDTRNYITAYYSDISAYRYVYDIRPAQVLLKVRFKLK
ncbi:TonB-dependent receptor [Bacteroidia bacterium]|nr:TonB-dependent receptor [Bacteroidia bacterium]GHU91596.1 TonB-dependent receptor [Bacteroidia bacterium]